ncbi:MAG: hypothetical protein KDJ75_00390 [Alphaproteobacteria bacterium]|nr:hypothetical protein [Alphaproteobacteria bacterium]
MDKDVLDNLLTRRAVPQTPGGLAERIIEAAAASQSGVQVAAKPQYGWIGTFVHGLLLPRPAFVLTLIFCLGLAVGTSSSFFSPALDTGEDDLSTFLLVGDEFETGDFS